MSLEHLVERALAETAREMTARPDVATLVARGQRARRRRRVIMTAVVAALVVVAAVAGPVVRTRVEPAPVSATPTPTPSSFPTATVGPGRGTSYFLGSRPESRVTVTLPAGWEIDGVWIEKSGPDPKLDIGFVDAVNLYSDGCRWRLLDPRPGPSVEDLVSAYRKVPGSGTAKDVTIDGYAGKQIDVAVPDYSSQNCQDGKFGFMQHDNDAGRGDEPTVGAMAPGWRYQVQILDVDGTRLVIIADFPPDISAQDRSDIDSIIRSLDIV